MGRVDRLLDRGLHSDTLTQHCTAWVRTGKQFPDELTTKICAPPQFGTPGYIDGGDAAKAIYMRKLQRYNLG